MKKLLSLMLALALCLSAMIVPALAESDLAVAVVVAGTLGDRGFYDSSVEGLNQLVGDHGVASKVFECKEDASLYESSLYDAADTCNVVIAVGWQFWDYLATACAEYPEVKFIFIDNGLDGVGDNLMSIIYAQNEGSFLVGYIAAKLSKTGKIGVVGGEDAATINDFIVGYEAGAKYANPDVVVERQYAQTYEDPAKGKECALALYDGGCDIVFAVAGKTGEGVFEAAAETGNYAIGVDSDQKYINPDVILCSMVKQVGKSIYDVVADLDGKYQPGKIWTADMETGYIDVAYGTDDMVQQVSPELKAEVEALKAKIISGEIEVPTALN
ncbi:MAG: BMP family ABC transporter substrate-binding protein [Clostridia bacterium]|nr:BMP family ABC transporter substrate-binding protein [Clostridia bacterium]